MINKQMFLTLLASIGIILSAISLRVEPGNAQSPDGGGASQTVEPAPSATPVFELTTAGWLEPGSLEPASNISVQALNPVDCAVLTPPVVGFEISRGQNPNDIADFSNDLTANGFSLGTVDLSSGVIPACVSVLIVQGSAGVLALSSPYTAADGALLKAWTASGHGLMLSGEFGTFAAGTQELFLAYGYSQQGPGPVSDPSDFDPAGPALTPNSWVIYQMDNFAGHPILSGVASLEFLASSWLAPAANAIVTADADANPATVPVMAALTDGLGCAVLATDSNWNSVVGTVNGYFKQQNATVARQMVQWLNSCASLKSSLKLSKIASPSPVQAGGWLTYTLTASNDSAATVPQVIVTDTVPPSTTFVTASGPFAGPAANGVVTWSLGTLNPNASTAVTMVVQVDNTVPTGTLIANTAWVTSSQGLSDTAAILTLVNVQLVDPLLTKAVNTNQAQVGDVVTFTLTVQQAIQSSSNATNVQVVDSLPLELDLLGAPQVTDGFTVVTGQVVTWTIPLLAPTDVRLMTIQAKVNNTTAPPLTIRNQATLSFDEGPARLSNQVELLVPAAAPSATPSPTLPPPATSSPTSPPPATSSPTLPPPDSQEANNDNNNNNNSVPPTATPVPATAVSFIVPAATTAPLPVAYLPETGYRRSYTRRMCKIQAPRIESVDLMGSEDVGEGLSQLSDLLTDLVDQFGLGVSQFFRPWQNQMSECTSNQ